MEDNSEDVRIGKVLHESMEETDNSEIAIENIKIDKITNQYVVEYKKSDADLQAATTQIKYYLYILNKKGIKRNGRIEIFEKNKQDRKVHYVEFDDNLEKEVKELLKEIQILYEQENPPQVKFINSCKKCAYFEYCNI